MKVSFEILTYQRRATEDVNKYFPLFTCIVTAESHDDPVQLWRLLQKLEQISPNMSPLNNSPRQQWGRPLTKFGITQIWLNMAPHSHLKTSSSDLFVTINCHLSLIKTVLSLCAIKGCVVYHIIRRTIYPLIITIGSFVLKSWAQGGQQQQSHYA